MVAHERKKETCFQGVASHAHHPFTDGEQQHQQTILCESSEHGNITHYDVPTFMNFKCHMIANIDCVSQWQKVLFQPHDILPEFAANHQLTWSKKVTEEHDACQIVFNPKTQFIVHLLVWLFGWCSI